MRNRFGKWMIAGTLALALSGLIGAKLISGPSNPAVCKEKGTEKNEKMIRSVTPIWENVTRHLVRM
jgi:hypothetical protein